MQVDGKEMAANHFSKMNLKQQCGGISMQLGGGKGTYFNAVYAVALPYELRKGNEFTVTECDGSRLKLGCPKGHELELTKAFYGRHPKSGFCGPATLPGCAGPGGDVTQRLKRACDRSNFCHVNVCRPSLTSVKGHCEALSSSVYLQVSGRCVKSKLPAPKVGPEPRVVGGATLTQVNLDGDRFVTPGLMKKAGLTQAWDQTGSGGIRVFQAKNKCTMSPPEDADCKRVVCPESNKRCCVDSAFAKAKTLCRSSCITVLPNGLKSTCAAEAGMLHSIQNLVECRGARFRTGECLAASDGKVDTSIELGHDSKVTWQYATAREVDSLRVYYPPTADGGTATLPRNKFGFQLQCFVGGRADAVTDDSKWQTMLTTPLAAVSRGSLGWKVFALQSRCRKPTHTYRLTAIAPALGSAKLWEATLAFSGFKPAVAGPLPVLHGVRMTVEPATLTILTHFTPKSSLRDYCVQTETAHHASGACSNLRDADVNSAVIFNNRCGKFCKAMKQVPPMFGMLTTLQTYTSVWVYYNPLTHKWLARRLRTFDLLAQGPDKKWVKVVDQRSSNGAGQFRAAANIKHAASPCTTCWVEIKFEKAVEANAFRFTGLNANAHGHVYVFEVAFGAKGVKTELAPIKPARIQGWCNIHTKIPLKSFAAVDTSRPATSARLLGSPYVPELKRIPCRSATAVEFDIPKFGIRGRTKMGYVMLPIKVDVLDATQCHTLTARTGGVGYSSYHVGKWSQDPTMKRGVERCKGWGSMKRHMCWCGCVWKADRCNRWQWHYKTTVSPITLLSRRVMRSPKMHVMVSTGSYQRSKVDYRFYGDWHMTVWYKPPFEDTPCLASGYLQAQVGGGDAAMKPNAANALPFKEANKEKTKVEKPAAKAEGKPAADAKKEDAKPAADVKKKAEADKTAEAATKAAATAASRDKVAATRAKLPLSVKPGMVLTLTRGSKFCRTDFKTQLTSCNNDSPQGFLVVDAGHDNATGRQEIAFRAGSAKCGPRASACSGRHVPAGHKFEVLLKGNKLLLQSPKASFSLTFRCIKGCNGREEDKELGEQGSVGGAWLYDPRLA